VPQALHAQSTATLARAHSKSDGPPEFARANFGIEFYDIATGKVVYSLNANKLFVPASTNETLTEGTVSPNLAPTTASTRSYTGPVLSTKKRFEGRPHLVASGDPNLSNRTQPDGTLASWMKTIRMEALHFLVTHSP